MNFTSIIADDMGLIPYRKELNKITGSVTATILLQQILYWYKHNGNKPFYKFIEPCGHELYSAGDSWTEELGFTKREFTTAYKKLEDAGFVSKKTNISRVTYYDVDIEALEEAISGLYSHDEDAHLRKVQKRTYVSDKSAFIKSTNPHLHIDQTSNVTETTTETTTERKKSIKKSAFSFSLKRETAYENLSREYKSKLYAKCLLISGSKQKTDDFILSLEAKGYKYKNFLSAFKKWHGITGNETHSNFSPEPILGEEWVRVIHGDEAIAINVKTLEMQTGKVKQQQIEEPRPEMSAKSFFEELERRKAS